MQYVLKERMNPNNAEDILKTLFRSVWRTTAKDLWARECPEYRSLEAEGMLAENWTPNMRRQEAFPLQMRVRTKLFANLSEWEQTEWQEKAAKLKDNDPTAEEWHPLRDGKVLQYANTLQFRAWDQFYRAILAKDCNSDVSEVVQLAPWKPKVSVYIPREAVKITEILLIDPLGIIISPQDAIKPALVKVMDMNYALRPGPSGKQTTRAHRPPWDRIALDIKEGHLEDWAEPTRLPRPDFPFEKPEHYTATEALELSNHLVQGELGELPEERVFRWKGQGTSRGEGTALPLTRKHAKRKRPVKSKPIIDGESFDLDGVGGSSSDEDEVQGHPPVKKPRTDSGKKPEQAVAKGSSAMVNGRQQNDKHEQTIAQGISIPGMPKAKMKTAQAAALTNEAKPLKTKAPPMQNNANEARCVIITKAEPKASKSTFKAKASSSQGKGKSKAISKAFAPKVVAAEKATQDPKPTESLAETTNEDISKPKRKAETAKESGNDEMIVMSNGQGKKKKGKEEEVVSGKAAEQKAEVAEGRVDEEQPRKPAHKGKPQPTVRVAFKRFVTVSKVPLPFNGVLQLWHANYYHRERLLDWEEQPVGVWESSCMSSARFIEVNELEQGLKLGAVLDLTPSFDDYEEKEAALFSEVVDAFKTLPLLDQFPGIKNVDGFLNSIQKRVGQGLDAIIGYPTDKGLTRMKIGGPCGLSAILRMTEFYRCSVTAMGNVNETSEDMGERLRPVEALLDRMEIVLAKEQWRRWASASFAIGAVPRVDGVRCVWYVWMEAIMSAPTEMEKVCFEPHLLLGSD
ncbi:hypothetical protein M422DRAFT_267298 [Sphaerobolus stellatus SS14]|uniref:Uncharacterized protein n=1 Tax=Sphaerobolus stellatus (strain SS14) TaxID=990650 RepID=A0A0C9V0D5_SPHS4|nr:hypothetical protein M422DRAFT_267298 [Sphaerobolus stellatus SS14]